MHINGKTVLKNATTAWCIGHHGRLVRVTLGFDAALGFDFILNALGFICLFPDGVEWW